MPEKGEILFPALQASNIPRHTYITTKLQYFLFISNKTLQDNKPKTSDPKLLDRK
jgi:hypothetical protein